MIETREIQLGEGTVVLETGRMARQADGSCTVRLGDTVVLATATMAREGLPKDFLPLTVDYKENTYAGGRIYTTFATALNDDDGNEVVGEHCRVQWVFRVAAAMVRL